MNEKRAQDEIGSTSIHIFGPIVKALVREMRGILVREFFASGLTCIDDHLSFKQFGERHVASRTLSIGFAPVNTHLAQ